MNLARLTAQNEAETLTNVARRDVTDRGGRPGISARTEFEDVERRVESLEDRTTTLAQPNKQTHKGPYIWQVAQKAGELFQNHETGECVGMPHPEATMAVVVVTEEDEGVTVVPAAFWKTRVIVERILERHDMHVGTQVMVECGKVGVGMASSTTSMRAAGMATYKALGIYVDHVWLAAEMATIEPSDSNTSDGKLALWNFFKGARRTLDYSLPVGAYVVAIPPAHHTLLTADVNRTRPVYTDAERAELADLRVNLLRALEADDTKGLSRVASRSIEINDAYFPKPELRILQELHSNGITFGHFGGHSGTILGAIGAVGHARVIAEQLAGRLPSDWTIAFYDYTARARSKPFLRVRPNFIHRQPQQ